MQAQEYYRSLISQGYTAEQAKQYTVQHYPDFEPVMPTPNAAQPLPEIPVPILLPEAPVPMPLPGISPLPLGDLPPPFVSGALPKPESVGAGGMDKKKIISIALAGILVVAGVVGIMYAFGVFDQGDADFVGEWVDSNGYVVDIKENGSMYQSYWTFKDEPRSKPSAYWNKSADIIKQTTDRFDDYDIEYLEKTNSSTKFAINGGVMFLKVTDFTQIRIYGDGEIYEVESLPNPGDECVAVVNTEWFEFDGETWSEDASNTWYSMVNSVDVPSWCDNEFKNEYRFSFSTEQDDSYYGTFFLTLEQSKWDYLEISDMAFFITIDGGSEIECFYDGYDDVCSYIPQFGSEKIYPGSVIAFGRGDAWEADCSSGCDLYIRVVQNTDSGQILIDEFSESVVYDDGP